MADLFAGFVCLTKSEFKSISEDQVDADFRPEAQSDDDNDQDDLYDDEPAGDIESTTSKQKMTPLVNKWTWTKTKLIPGEIDKDIQFTTSDDELTPLQYFKTLFDDEVIDCIVDQTNLYSVQRSVFHQFLRIKTY
ncbi:hypothetical protein LOTGIDRAFT_174746 [Lottia gigantea]|uniref:PiggyBac transposable element-derived protein domain-containing protein n=1 Tax=Lottia gigantea TaxID=225164 RepID=V4C503_LOTGI|nr:hypothetical protein LOTGIDRAFT_174746 [Lottia gigantea]ESO96669.1 hypothetical protein LOTGIDRAFT_174746 [Lottia gigantea]